jgi:flagellar biosynthesis/type III secretory pathway M-ring protein FliF/YscJ
MDRKRIIITVVSGLIFLTVLFFYLRPITAPRSITEEELEKIPTEKFFEGEKKEEIKE